MKHIVISLLALLAGCGNNLPYEISGDNIVKPLSEEQADPKRGKELFSTRSAAHCVLCHYHDHVDAPFPGNLGPDLSNVYERLSAAQIRLRIVDYDAVIPGTTMPSYYRIHDLRQLPEELNGQTVLTPLEIEDIIAFLVDDD